MRLTTIAGAAVLASAVTGGCSLLVSLEGFAESTDPAGPTEAAVDGDLTSDGSREAGGPADAAPPDGDDGGDAATDGGVDLLTCSAPGLVAYYQFDEGAGLVASNCVGEGTYPGQITGATWTTPIEGASALRFEGTHRIALAASLPLMEDPTTRSVSITAAVIATTAALPAYGRMVSKCEAVTTGCNGGLELLIEGRSDGGTPGLAFRVPTVNTLSDRIQDPAGFPVDVVVHVAGVYDATGTPIGRVYRDGDLVAAQVLAGARRDTGGPVSIGIKGDTSNGNRFVGTIDEVRIWNRVLTACEVRILAGKTCP